ncbi:unnamed protein product [Prorocentrum cordatum]|uniref:Glycosyltransferase family 28 N-terminal domain-containing protein n=1 Tax=Prorocentrum cordatum TaxID=2364126 RepID=A0ABN9PN15_9DINO|nr:unnamed protein product [Polarella glacialis]
MGRAAADVERHELWLWESWEEHLRLGFESAEFWQACNCWNWSYWLLLVLVVVPVNMAVELLQLHAERAFDAYTTVALGASVAAWLGCLGSLGLAPQRGHTVMVWVASSLFVLHYGNLFLVTEQCHGARQSHIACAKELVLTQPPLHLVVFVFSSCRLRPLLAVVVCGACCALSLLWSLSLTVRDVVESRGEVDAAQVHTAIGSVLCGVLLIFGAQAGASVFKRQKYIFEYLSDHASLTRAHGSSRLACDFDSIGGGARRFFASYLDRTLVTRFPDASADEEKRFARWRLASARAWLRRRGHYLVAGVGGLALPYLWLSWDQYARAELALSCATLQTAAMLLMLSAAVALGCRGGSEGWPVWVFMGAQLAFSASFLWCGGLGKVDSAPRVPRAVLPSDPFVFLVFSAHSMWSLGVRPILLFDLLVLGIFFAILASRAAHHVDELGVNVFTMSSRMLLVVVECLSLTLTLEKYDRVLWRLHSSASEAPVGSFASFASFAGAPSADRASSLQAPRDVRLSVVGFSAAYSDDVFYFIEVDASGYPPHVALRSVPALRAAFLRLLESGEAEAERSFDALVDATEPQLRRASLRLERILRRALPTADTACRVLGLRPDDAQRCPALAPRLPVPRMDVLLLAVGSRGDVQVFISTARALSSAGHRCRLATHAQFEQLVLAAGVEFYPLATTDPVHWQPEQLMQHMEANPGLGPEMLLRPQDLVKMLLHTPEMTHALQQLVLPAQPPDREGLEPAVGPWAIGTVGSL